MKYLLYVTIVFSLVSCKKEAVETYQGKDGVSFLLTPINNYIPQQREVILLPFKAP